MSVGFTRPLVAGVLLLPSLAAWPPTPCGVAVLPGSGAVVEEPPPQPASRSAKRASAATARGQSRGPPAYRSCTSALTIADRSHLLIGSLELDLADHLGRRSGGD